MLTGYQKLGGSAESTLVNSLWCDPGLTLDGVFTEKCRQLYYAELFHADLQNADTVKELNSWVDEATNGLIPEVVDKFSDNAVMALVTPSI